MPLMLYSSFGSLEEVGIQTPVMSYSRQGPDSSCANSRGAPYYNIFNRFSVFGDRYISTYRTTSDGSCKILEAVESDFEHEVAELGQESVKMKGKKAV